MPEKAEVLASITKPSYSKAEVMHLVNSVSLNKENKSRPDYLRKGDVFGIPMGNKIRPVVIFKIAGDVVYGIPLTSTNNEMVLCPSTGSRFSRIEDGHGDFFGRGIHCSTVEFARNNFLFVYDNRTALNFALRELRKIMTKVLK